MNILTYLRLKFDLGSDEGATATEYVFLLAGIALLIIGAVWALGGALSGAFESAKNGVAGTVPSS